jgi:hypothetical protein
MVEEKEQEFSYNNVTITRYEIYDLLGYDIRGVSDEVMQDLVEEISEELEEEYGDFWYETIDEEAYWDIIEKIISRNSINGI